MPHVLRTEGNPKRGSMVLINSCLKVDSPGLSRFNRTNGIPTIWDSQYLKRSLAKAAVMVVTVDAGERVDNDLD